MIVASLPACVGLSDGGPLLKWNAKADQPIPLPDAEHMIDDLDRIMTAYGTISIKTPDVWGQDRLAKFRSEYEAQMAGWLKQGFKGDINASVRHSESEATQVQVGADLDRRIAEERDRLKTDDATLATLSKAQAALDATLPPLQSTPEKTRFRSSPRSCSTSTRTT